MPKKFKIDDFKSLFCCELCNKLTVQPVTLPCGVSICESHIKEISLDDCKFCCIEHKKSDLQVNKAFSRMLELKVNEIKLDPKYDNYKKEIDSARSIMNEIENITKSPDSYIYEYFEKIKQNVDLTREALKQRIDAHSDAKIAEITQYQTDYIKLAKEMDFLSFNIREHQTELDTLIESFDSFEFVDAKYDVMLSKVNILQPKLKDLLVDLKHKLLDYNDYKFVTGNRPLDKIFGSLANYSMKVRF